MADQDEQSFYMEQTITIKPITVNAFENNEVWKAERKAIQEQYLKIIRDKNFRALEWYTDMGGHYIFHPSVKSGDWQLSFIDNRGIPTSDSQYKDEDIGTGRWWIDPIVELPHSRPYKTITIKALFENPNRERGNMEEDYLVNDTEISEVTHGEDFNGKEQTAGKEKPQVKFFVAEAMEFHTLGEMYEDIPTIDEAIKIFDDLPESKRYMGNGIGAVVNDWEYSLYEGGEVDTLEYYEDSIKENADIKNAIKALNSYESERRIRLFEDKGFEFPNKDEYSDNYKNRLAQNLRKYSDLHYTDEATVYLAQASGKFINVDNAGINPQMKMDELTLAINRQAGIIDFKDLDTMDYVVLDTETTGFNNDDEIVELGITDRNGNVLYEGMFNPNKELSEEASKVNGITMNDLANKPSFGTEAQRIADILLERPLVIYNKDFDTRLVLQSMEAHKEDIADYDVLKEKINEKFQTTTYCAMQSYTAYKDFYKSTKLVEALKEQGVDKVQSHRAVDDCIDTANLIKVVADKEKGVQNVAQENTKDSEYLNSQVVPHGEKKSDITLHADNAKGDVVWKAEKEKEFETPPNEVDTGKEAKAMAEKTTTTGDEKLSVKDQLMKQLADGIKNTLDSEHFADWCKKQGRLYYNNYSLRNAMLTYLQKPEASYVCGYEKWKEFGRQVKQGAKGIKVLAPSFVKEYGAKGSLLASIKKACNEQLKKDHTLEYATFRLGQSKLSFIMYKNGLFDVKVGEDVIMAHITSDEMRKFLDRSVIGKIPAYYNAITVFDVQDTTNEVEILWVKDNYKKEELVLDDNGNPIKNKKGQYKIFNSEERKARFNADIDMTIKETDAEKMEILYDTLKTISNNKGIPFTEADPSLDETLAGGALGYYRHPTPEHDKGNIIVSSELSITDKVAVAFHEMAHSDLHADIDWLKDEMDLDAGEKVTRQMKETQAEAVAYMTASNFGIETEHKSFEYIANWSNGRELKELEKSLDVIYKESRQLMKDIEAELDTRGLTLAMEAKDKTPLSEDVKAPIVASYKEVVVNTMRDNEVVQKTAFEDFKSVSDEVQKGIVKEQITLSHKIDEQVAKLNEHIDKFENSTDRQEQTTLQYQMKADVAKITSMQTQLNNLSEERVTTALEQADEKKSDMKALYASNPIKAMEQLQKDNEQMKDLTKNDLKYLATSKFVSREYSKFLGSDNEQFVELAMKQLDNLKEAMSKNKTAVEIVFCEQWGDKPIFKAGTIAHPKVANKIIAQAEKQTQAFKKKAESENDYYPYSKCDVTVYSITGKDKLTVLNTRVDIGDAQQKDLTDHLTQICAKGNEKQAVLDNFIKSTRERGKTLLLTPQLEHDTKKAVRAEEHSSDKTMSMSSWKSELNINSNDKTQNKEEQKKDNSEKERA